MKHITIYLLLFPFLIFAQQIETVSSTGTYAEGEPITFQITGYSGTLTYTYAYAGNPYQWSVFLPTGTSAQATINGSGVITIPPPPTSKQATVICRLQNGSTGVAIYNPIAAGPHYAPPNNFSSFWINQYQQANTIPDQLMMGELDPNHGTHNRYTFRIKTISSNHTLAGYIFVPKSGSSHPMMMRHFPAGASASPSLWPATPSNLIVVHCNFYNTTSPNQAVGSIEGGSTDPNAFELRHIMLGSIKLIDYFHSSALDTRISFNQQDFGIYGNSRGGGMALIVGGLDHLLGAAGLGRTARTKVISASAPAFAGNSDGNTKLTGYPHWVYGGASNNTASAYYDVIHFSTYYPATTFMEVNYFDNVCPAETNLAALNQLRGKAILASNPTTGHQHGGCFWNYSIDEFLRRNLNANLNTTGNASGYDVDAGNNFSTSVNVLHTLNAQAWKENSSITNSLSNVSWDVMEPAGSSQVVFPSGNTQANSQVRFTASGTYTLRFSGEAPQDGTYGDNDRPDGFYTFIDYVTVTVGGGGNNCAITATNATTLCNDQGTVSTADDTFTITVNPTGANTSGTYRAWVNGVSYGVFTLGTAATLNGQFPIAQGAVQLVIEDANSSNCALSQTLPPPATCSSSGCGGTSTTSSGCGFSVSVSGQTVSLVSRPSSGGPYIVKVRRADWSEQQDLCNDYGQNPSCSAGSSTTVTGTGTYVVDVQGGSSPCTFNITVDGSSGGGGGTDMDGDGHCSDVDCDDNDPSVGPQQSPGTACNDGSANTTNDQIQTDGCTCQGTPIGGGCGGNSGTTASGCGMTVSISGQTVSLTATPSGGPYIVKIRRANWSEQQDLCNDYSQNPACSASSSTTVTGTGTYVVDVQGGGSPCTFNITVDGSSGGGGGTDADGDGHCSDVDCDDNDPSVGPQQVPGTVCNDGNANTTNDQIQTDGCTCLGIPIGCTDQDNDGFCVAVDCDDLDPNVGAQQAAGTSCNDGNANTTNDQIQADGCTCQGTLIGGGTTVSGCGMTVSINGQTVSLANTPVGGPYIIKVRRPNWSEQEELCNGYSQNPACVAGSSTMVNGTGTYVVDVQGGASPCTFNINVGGSNLMVQNGTETSVSIFPNPTNGLLHLRAKDIETVKMVEVFNLHGQRILQQQANVDRIDLTRAPAGLYQVRIYTIEGILNTTVVRQ